MEVTPGTLLLGTTLCASVLLGYPNRLQQEAHISSECMSGIPSRTGKHKQNISKLSHLQSTTAVNSLQFCNAYRLKWSTAALPLGRQLILTHISHGKFNLLSHHVSPTLGLHTIQMGFSPHHPPSSSCANTKQSTVLTKHSQLGLIISNVFILHEFIKKKNLTGESIRDVSYLAQRHARL